MSRAAESRPKLALAFPGVGVRPSGYEEGFFRRHHRFMKPLLDEASSYAGADLLGCLGESLPSRLLSELQGQLLTYAFNCAVAEAYLKNDIVPSLAAGHSMGLYSALTSAGVISFADGLIIVEGAYRFVTEASSLLGCSMAVVVGLGQHEIDDLLAARPAEDSVCLVNSNNDTTKIFAGTRPDLEEFLDAAQGQDALKARLLPVSAPYHHRGYLTSASADFKQLLGSFSWSRARFPVVSSIDQSVLIKGEDLLDLTARNISTPIDWEKVVLTMIEHRIELILECGAGLSLAQNGRLMPKCPPFATVKNSRRRVGL